MAGEMRGKAPPVAKRNRACEAVSPLAAGSTAKHTQKLSKVLQAASQLKQNESTMHTL